MNTWHTEPPATSRGTQTDLWCACRTRGGNIYHATLEWCNHYHFQASDDYDQIPEGAIDDGDGGFYYTGWMNPACESCETQYAFIGDVAAWMVLPSYDSLQWPPSPPPPTSNVPW